jgi:hypothetical protein
MSSVHDCAFAFQYLSRTTAISVSKGTLLSQVTIMDLEKLTIMYKMVENIII